MSEIGHNSEGVAADELRQFVERIERVEEEIAGLNSDKSDIFKELKGRGFDAKAVRSILRIRRKDHAERQEEEAILALYLEALGILRIRRKDHAERQEEEAILALYLEALGMS